VTCILTAQELFKRRLHISKNVSIDFDEVLPFYKSSPTDGVEDDADLTDNNTSFALPSKASAEKLVQSFFTNWHPMFPVLHRPSFQWDFEAMYTEKASKDPAHFAQMWLVLAIAARDAAGKVGLISVARLTLFRDRSLPQTIPNSGCEHDTSSDNCNGNPRSTASKP
jgi:hypothetical protein